MELVVVTPPAVFLTLVEATDHLRLNSGDDDARVTRAIAGACSAIDGPEGWLNRAIMQHTVSVYFDEFPVTSDLPLRLPLPRVTAIDEVAYVDADGADQILDVGSYRLVWANTDRASLDLSSGGTWPSTLSQAGVVSVKYKTGYASIGLVPPAIKSAAFLVLGDLYEHGQTAIVGSVANYIPLVPGVEALLRPYRVFLKG